MTPRRPTAPEQPPKASPLQYAGFFGLGADYKRFAAEQVLKYGLGGIISIVMFYFWVVPSINDARQDRADKSAAFLAQQLLLNKFGESFSAQKEIQVAQLEAIKQQSIMLGRQSEMLEKQYAITSATVVRLESLLKMQHLVLQKMNLPIPHPSEEE